MDIKAICNKINLFFKLAASPETFKLTNNFGKKMYSDLWFGESMAELNNETKNFAVLDNKIKAAIRNLERNYGIIGSEDVEDVTKFYLSHDKTQELIRFICDSYDQKMTVSSQNVLQHLLDDGSLDPDSGIATNPIFILMHDLIHQAIEHDFVEQLENQQDGEVITLLDQLNEDLASSLSNFQPKANASNQGLVAYIRYHFLRNLKNDFSEQDLVNAIEKTFYLAKAELRSKIDKIKLNMSEEYVSKMKKVSPKLKQLVDGILSKLKYAMLQGVKSVANSKQAIGYGKYYKNAFDAFELQEIFDEYNEKITTSLVMDQVDSSALRAWMISCLSKMKELLNYFEYGFEEENFSNEDEEEDY